MAYDLARGTVSSRNYSITLPPHSMTLAEKVVLGTVSIATLTAIMGEMEKQAEKRKYQRDFRKGLKTTLEMPAIPMRELMARGKLEPEEF
jgi:hypothetical protein